MINKHHIIEMLSMQQVILQWLGRIGYYSGIFL